MTPPATPSPALLTTADVYAVRRQALLDACRDVCKCCGQRGLQGERYLPETVPGYDGPDSRSHMPRAGSGFRFGCVAGPIHARLRLEESAAVQPERIQR